MRAEALRVADCDVDADDDLHREDGCDTTCRTLLGLMSRGRPVTDTELERSWGSRLPPPFTRPFRVVNYHIGHSELLLRTCDSAADGSETNIDVVFEGVAAMLLVRDYPELRITIANQEQIEKIRELGFDLPDFTFILSESPLSFVAAGKVTFREGVGGGFLDPSPIGIWDCRVRNFRE